MVAVVMIEKVEGGLDGWQVASPKFQLPSGSSHLLTFPLQLPLKTPKWLAGDCKEHATEACTKVDVPSPKTIYITYLNFASLFR